jgi:endonuclease YncB( thermonuclease family)
MRRTATFIAGAIGLLLWAFLVVSAGQSFREDPVDYDMQDLDVPDPAELDLPDVSAVPAADAETAPETAAIQPPRRVRAIEPQQFASPAFVDAGDLERVEARMPLADPPKRSETKVVLLHRPNSLQAGVIGFGEAQTVRLVDVTATELGRTCPNAGDGTWACGVMARTQQRLFIRNRSLACETASAAWRGEIRTRCWIGLQDVSAWLAKQGWAEAEPESSLASLTELARAERRGLFGDAVR